jgi:hypothetical protein
MGAACGKPGDQVLQGRQAAHLSSALAQVTNWLLLH